MHVADVLGSDPEIARSARRILTEPATDFPILSVKFKLTWRCNLRCSLCRLWQKPYNAATPDVTLGQVETILKALKERGLRKVHFSGGEVLILDEFPRIVEAARSMDLQVNLTTNGTLLDKDVARSLVNNRVHAVNVSIDAADEKRHDRMRGVKGAWKRAWRGVDNLIERKRNKGRGPVVAVNTIVTRDNAAEMDSLYDMLIERGVDRWRLLPVDTQIKKIRPTAEQWQELAKKWERWRENMSRLPIDWSSEQSAKKAAKGKYAGRFYHDRACFAPWFNLFIDADGKTYPCCMGKTHMRPYGNAFETPVSELLAGEGRKEICCSLASGHLYPICERCDDFLEENEAFAHLYKMEEIK